MLLKGVCPYEHIDEWEKFNEKYNFYSNLNMEDITDADCMHTKSVCKNFEMEVVGEYYELY